VHDVVADAAAAGAWAVRQGGLEVGAHGGELASVERAAGRHAGVRDVGRGARRRGVVVRLGGARRRDVVVLLRPDVELRDAEVVANLGEADGALVCEVLLVAVEDDGCPLWREARAAHRRRQPAEHEASPCRTKCAC
jgi:hypothetical protein